MGTVNTLYAVYGIMPWLVYTGFVPVDVSSEQQREYYNREIQFPHDTLCKNALDSLYLGPCTWIAPFGFATWNQNVATKLPR